MKGKEKAEASVAKQKDKVAHLTHTVRTSRQAAREAKRLQSQAEMETKNARSVAEEQIDREMQALEAELMVSLCCVCCAFSSHL